MKRTRSILFVLGMLAASACAGMAPSDSLDPSDPSAPSEGSTTEAVSASPPDPSCPKPFVCVYECSGGGQFTEASNFNAAQACKRAQNDCTAAHCGTCSLFLGPCDP